MPSAAQRERHQRAVVFDEPGLEAEGSFKAAEARYISHDQIAARDLKRWLEKSIVIQWDYKNIVKRKGKLKRLK